MVDEYPSNIQAFSYILMNHDLLLNFEAFALGEGSEII